MIIIPHEHALALGQHAHHQIGRTEHLGAFGNRNRLGVEMAHAILAPGRTGGNGDARYTESQHVIRRQPTIEIGFDIGKLVELQLAVIRNAHPGRKTGQLRFLQGAATQLRSGFGQKNRITALAERLCRFQPSRTAADDQHGLFGARLADLFRMPALAPLLGHGRVLGAAHR